jgi:septal ring-binding cell division protein DamX
MERIKQALEQARHQRQTLVEASGIPRVRNSALTRFPPPSLSMQAKACLAAGTVFGFVLASLFWWLLPGGGRTGDARPRDVPVLSRAAGQAPPAAPAGTRPGSVQLHAPPPVTFPELTLAPDGRIDSLAPTAPTGNRIELAALAVAETPEQPESADPPPPPATHEVPASPTSPAQARKPLHGESWLVEQAPDQYTLQILGVHNEAALKKFVKTRGLEDDSAYFRRRLRGKDWFVLLYGSYPDAQAARRAISELPASIRRHKPWPRSMAAVQAEIASRSSH